MLLIRNRKTVPPELRAGSVATVGSFDGLHLGHRHILGQVRARARELELPAAVVAFEPAPKEFFARTAPPARLMRFREKFAGLAEFGIDVFYCPRFDAAMAARTPAEFIDELLLGVLNVKYLVVGDDFRFARQRSGSVTDLEHAGAAAGFTVEQVPTVVSGGLRASSSGVRAALAAGDLAAAARQLGRPYRMAGQVVAGQQLGRELGMPTANVRLKRSQSPLQGVFAVRVSGIGDDRWHDGVASIGTRPTVNGVEPLLEVHIFDFAKDIYGAHIQVEFIAKLRDEQYFPDLETLAEHMQRDAEHAREQLRVYSGQPRTHCD
ncbi:MAG: bifunctional riboflavin kinase/FAD synthetase [Gammaproteobacteria bacterium]|jgi:riboflavin kinase/FMN adenylyltransferase|nr:bifunctional riboflavin kinase/FAD synthetase [Gammaproteobacteria bacterium]